MLTVLTIEEVQTTFLYFWSARQNAVLHSISSGLTHRPLSTGLHCTIAKWRGRFLMKMNKWMIWQFCFCIFVIYFRIGTFFTTNLYIPRGKDTESVLLAYNLTSDALKIKVNTIVMHYSVYFDFQCIRRY